MDVEDFGGVNRIGRVNELGPNGSGGARRQTSGIVRGRKLIEPGFELATRGPTRYCVSNRTGVPRRID